MTFRPREFLVALPLQPYSGVNVENLRYAEALLSMAIPRAPHTRKIRAKRNFQTNGRREAMARISRHANPWGISAFTARPGRCAMGRVVPGRVRHA